jgi:hypothetical protein
MKPEVGNPESGAAVNVASTETSSLTVRRVDGGGGTHVALTIDPPIAEDGAVRGMVVATCEPSLGAEASVVISVPLSGLPQK